MDAALKVIAGRSLNVSEVGIKPGFKIGTKADSDLILHPENHVRSQLIFMRTNEKWLLKCVYADTTVNDMVVGRNGIISLENGDAISVCMGKYKFKFVLIHNSAPGSERKRALHEESSIGGSSQGEEMFGPRPKCKCKEVQGKPGKAHGSLDEMEKQYRRILRDKNKCIASLSEREALLKLFIEEKKMELTATTQKCTEVSKDLQNSNHLLEKLREEVSCLRRLHNTEKMAEPNELKEVSGQCLTTVMEGLLQLLECPICCEVIIQPAVTKCRHTFCSHCIALWLNKKKECPLCQNDIAILHRSLMFDQLIEKFVELVETEEFINHRRSLRIDRKETETEPDHVKWFESTVYTIGDV